jgi:hypothetical protein
VVETHEVLVAADPAVTLAAVASVADAWGAEWRPGDGACGGELALPVIAGLRRGYVRGRVELYEGSTPDGTSAAGEDADRRRLVLAVAERHDHVQSAAVMILLLSGFGAVLTVLWPFFPSLLPVAPFGAVLALGGWFLVVSRLHNSGPEDFLGEVRKRAEGGEGKDGSGRRVAE